MATFGFSYGKSAAEWNVLLYLWWLGVGATPLRASRRTLWEMLLKNNQNHKMNHFFKTRLKSITFVLKGMLLLIKTEDAIKAQSIIFILFTALGFYFDISLEDWKWQLFCFALIFSAEGLNTAIEKICNFIHPEHHKQIGYVKF